ncbi:MAG: riboflavin synthase [Gammaproteobacteria bacterium]|jgi:riboflavin synthase|tara:strand:- start:1801 stop:2388 length:588 start_codon:yes stop_codon:yes gene_type:complete
MFTGIIENIGKIIVIEEVNNNYLIKVEVTNLSINISNGDSIAVNGACLTVVNVKNNIFSFDLSPETMKLTSFKYLTKDDLVNIEFPLTLNKFISGHITTGHIDTIGVIEKLLKDTDSWFIQIKVDKIYLKYIVHKGSICIDGVSLTINQVDGNMIDLMVIPHTYQNTIIKNYSLGDSVNIEVDYIAKHLEKLKND